MKQSKIMKNLLCLFSAALLIGCSGSDYQNSLQEEHLNGNVKSVRQLGFTFAEENGQVVILDTLATDNFLVLFDENGNETSRIFFAQNGDTIGIYHSEYDDKDRRTAQTGVDLAGNVMESSTFSYNNKGQQTERIFSNAEQVVQYKNTYDKSGNLTEIVISMETGKPLYVISFTYENGQVVGDRVLFSDFGNANETTYTNDEWGRELIAVANYLTPAGMVEMQETRAFVYEDDEKGNWLRKKSFVNGMPEKILERTIEYYQ
jgi:antitoxin component YwqK of YwqJK toxin-antitoxin module